MLKSRTYFFSYPVQTWQDTSFTDFSSIKYMHHTRRVKVSVIIPNFPCFAGCLLALLFLIPLAARLYSMVTLLLLAVVYVTVVVPMATGFYSAGSLFARLRCVFKR